MSNNAFVGNIFLERGDGGSPEAFTRVCQVYGISGVGEQNELQEVTTFCSGGSKEYVGGLADGTEITVDCNFETYQWELGALSAMIADAKARTVRSLQIVADDGVNAAVTFSFSALCMSWELGPSVDAKNTIKFGFKISGAVTIA